MHLLVNMVKEEGYLQVRSILLRGRKSRGVWFIRGIHAQEGRGVRGRGEVVPRRPFRLPYSPLDWGSSQKSFRPDNYSVAPDVTS